jgi:regulator of RNase E activity RraA
MSQAAALPDVIRDIERTPTDIVGHASAFPSSILADVAGRRGALHGRIAPLSPSMRFAGTAITVEVRPGDNLMIHAAMAIAQPGDVLVIDGKGDQSSALMGEIMSQQCVALGIAAVVMDGACRDSEEIRKLGFPMYSVGTNPNGPTKLVSGRLTIRSPSVASLSIRATWWLATRMA